MSTTDKKVVLITGASSGIGQAIAKRLTSKGHIVYGTSRNPKPLIDDSFSMLQMDVTEDASVQNALQEIIRQTGKIDVLINNAGLAIAGALEETSIEESKKVFEANVFGVHRVVQAALPYMRDQRSGRIISISSIAGQFGLPYRGIYCASKFALEGMMESLQYEIEPFNIDVVIVEPGDIKTSINQNRDTAIKAQTSPIYKEPFEQINKQIFEGVENGFEPDVVAAKVEQIIGMKKPKLKYQVAPLIPKLAVIANHIVPSFVFKWIIKTDANLK